jgi:hypothetical protein
MKVRNATAYNTRDLRRFFAAGLRAMNAKPDKVIEVKYITGGRHICWASLGSVTRTTVVHEGDVVTRPFRTVEGRWIRMLLPKPGLPIDYRWFARVFEHEVHHNKGATHREMTQHQKDCDLPLPEWAAGLEIREVQVLELSVGERKALRAQKREEHARAKLAAALRKKKLIETLIKRWRKRVYYYDRKMAAKRGAHAEKPSSEE